ncbi:MAG: hemin uptake protein HemP [Hydrogenophaga sp.]|nr:hemin uptake protein HemP [Hydrogenophaga sp.]MDZ4358192.1 hemin uptake protein HemP [Variovorax sp.]RJP65300.1 MAG: hemin uptake protein HemP [Comamonadaceae bacterium]
MKPTTTPSSAEPVNAQDAPAPATQDAHPVPVLPSADLLRGQKAVAIDHNGSLYRLQTTRQGKLILTK